MMNIARCPVCRLLVEAPLLSLDRKKLPRTIRSRIHSPGGVTPLLMCQRCWHEHASTLKRSSQRKEPLPISLRLNADPRFTGAGVTIAFIDSGFFTHPDLMKPRERIAAFVDVTDDSSIIDSGTPRPESWHGTMSSVVAAGRGILSRGRYEGIAKDADLVLIKVMDSVARSVTSENIALGLRWAIDHREKYAIRIANIAVGADQPEPLEQSAVDQLIEEASLAGIIVVAAAGNDPAARPVPPSSAPSAITVGGFDDHNQLREEAWSLYPSTFGVTLNGDPKPDVISLATHIPGPILPHTDQFRESRILFRILNASEDDAWRIFTETRRHIPPAGRNLKKRTLKAWVRSRMRAMKYIAPYYKSMEGTSNSAAIVSSVVAQMIEANPALTPGQVKEILLRTSIPIRNERQEPQGHGRLDARGALEEALLARYPSLTTGIHRGPTGISFLYRNPAASTVALAGDFNDWNPQRTPFHQLNGGEWTCYIPMPTPGNYQYKFVIDNRLWSEDPSNELKEPDRFGGWNSTLKV